MKKSIKLEFTLKDIALLIFFTFVIGGLISYIGILLYNLRTEDGSIAIALIGAFGNIAGGVIGGIVAYIVASYQVKKSMDLEVKKNSNGNSAILRLLKNELTTANKLLINCKNQYYSGDQFF